MMRSWLSRWRWGKPHAKPRRVPLRLEALEDRRVPAVFNPLPSAPDGAPGSLRADIIAANSNGQDNTIILQQGHYLLTLPNTAGQENAAATGDLDLTAVGHTITIQGAGTDVTVVDAGGIDRVFQVSGNSVSVVFRNLTITGGRAMDDGTAGAPSDTVESEGGGILNNGGTVTLDHVFLENNQAVGRTEGPGGFGLPACGGGISSNGTLFVQDCTIANNQAIGGPGAFGVVSLGRGGQGGGAGGGGMCLSGVAIITGTTIEMNQAIGGAGANGTDGVDGDPSGGSGGGAGGGGLSVGGSILGGVYVTINSSTICNNVAIGGVGGNGGLAGPSSYSYGGFGGWGGSASGGGIGGGISLISNSTTADNTAVGGSGGVGGNNSHGTPGQGGNGGTSQGGGFDGSIKVRNSTIAFNRAAKSHGGAAGTGNSTALAGVDGTGDGGGGISGLDAVSSIIADNTAEGGTHPDFSGTIFMASHLLLGDGTGSTLSAANPDANGNIIGTTANPIDPKLGQLGFYGGPTPTIPLLAGSPAIDAGTNPNGLTTDQRAFASRTVNGTADIGAFEFGAIPVVVTSQPPQASSPVPVFQTFTARLVRVNHHTRLDVCDATTGKLRLRLFPFGTSRGKVQLFLGDVNGDGVADIVVLGVQANRLRMRVFSGRDLSDLTASLT
jgi:hypothetical protein